MQTRLALVVPAAAVVIVPIRNRGNPVDLQVRQVKALLVVLRLRSRVHQIIRVPAVVVRVRPEVMLSLLPVAQEVMVEQPIFLELQLLMPAAAVVESITVELAAQVEPVVVVMVEKINLAVLLPAPEELIPVAAVVVVAATFLHQRKLAPVGLVS